MNSREKHDTHCYELTIERYPFDPIGSLSELKGRLKLSEEFKKPELWKKIEPTLISAQKNGDGQDTYWKFFEALSKEGDLILVMVYSQVYLTCLHIFQLERRMAMNTPPEALQRALFEELRWRMHEMLKMEGHPVD